ncbi:MAG: PepSY domain-containing protein [Deltaproteobacteria bacterium]|nr:PepSY domain-containing protein [Deltaproteobacteria bacterium]
MFLPWVLLVALAAPLGATDSDSNDHVRARLAREAGEIVPLATILAAVDAAYEGKIVEVELEWEKERWEYEIELLTDKGHVIELTYDAVNGRLLRTEGIGADQARKR